MRLWQKVVFVFLFVWGIIIPVILLMVTNKNELGDPEHMINGDLDQGPEDKKFQPPHEKRKILDYNPELHIGREEMQFQVKELEDIVLSVRNELRNLEQERTRLHKEVDLSRSSLNKVRRQVTTTKAELQDTKSKLARTLREMKRLNQRSFAEPVKSSVVVVNLEMPGVVMTNNDEGRQSDHQIAGKDTNNNYARSHSARKINVLDHSRCALMKPFGVYFVNHHHKDLFNLRHPGLVSSFLDVMTRTGLLVDEPDQACVFVSIVGSLKSSLDEATLKSNLASVPFWNKGSNHVVLNMAYANETADIYSESLDLGRAVYIRSYARGNHFDGMILPPVADDVQALPPPYLPTLRNWFVTFEGKVSSGSPASSDHVTSPEWVKRYLATFHSAISRNTQDRLLINTSCDATAHTAPRGGVNNRDYITAAGEWELCGTAQDRAAKLSASTFSLVIGSGSGDVGPFTYLRLVEALCYGAIPVVIGVDRLPLDEVIDWKSAAVILPATSLGQLHYVLKNLDQDTMLRYRRQGRHLWDTYFQTASKMVEGVMAVVRWKALHSPPPARDYKPPVTFLSRPGDIPPIMANTFQYNFTAYSWDFWNSPPGPAFMYPVTPFKPAPVSGTQYMSLSREQYSSLPGHVVAAGGITGPYFEDYLLGNAPEEHFTVVILTYERNQVLLDTIGRLANMDHLAKVLVVWNNPSPPPESMQWPDIGVAVEVVSTGRNSLNNRFLPFSNIETEAVLSLDDDVHLRHDEIQFAFRVWREARDRIVGFPGRFHAWDARHPGWLYNSNYTCELSMVLTGAAFIHKYYMYLYSQWMSDSVRQMVDYYTNCEDIAMNFLVSHITRKPPLKVTSRWTFRCPGCPETLSNNNEHFNERHICMNRLVSIYGYMPLLYTQFRLDSVLFKTRLPSHLEKCYEYI